MGINGLSQSLGNPLLLRHPLNAGVKVIAAHFASEGSSIDIDDKSSAAPSWVPAYELLFRLFRDDAYNELLFADISAILAFKRAGAALSQLMSSKDVHHRLINGSDYPVVLLNMVIWTPQLVHYGYITNAEAKLLREIFHINPMLFDVVTKRMLKLPSGERAFGIHVFLDNPLLFKV